MSAQMIWMARVKSVTMDEPNHIARGVTYLRAGDMRLGYLHPPLINVISALPLALDSSIVVPLDHSTWQNRELGGFANQFLWRSNANTQSIVFRARLPIVALTLLLALVVYAWARELYGRRASVLALTLTAFSPGLLAHGALATNDAGFTCFAILAAYAFWRWLQQPGWKRAAIASIAFGLAMATKLSALFLIPALALTAIAYWLSDPSEENPLRRIARLSGWLVLIGVAGALILWAIYGFKVGEVEGAGITLPAPGYIADLKLLQVRNDQGNPTFLFGSYSMTGWWYYFPVAFLAKTPLPAIALMVAAGVYVIRKRTWRKSLPLLIPVAIYFAVSMAGALNIGYRHLLPALVLLTIFASQLAEYRWESKPRLAWGAATVILWLVVSVGATFPDHLAYFSEIVGGTRYGYKTLGDSNLDWGQDLIGLKEYMQREGVSSVKLSYFGSVEPEVYGIEYEPLPAYPLHRWSKDYIPVQLLEPEPGVYAISVTNLQGIFFRHHELYAWFRERRPDAVIGHSIFVYRVK